MSLDLTKLFVREFDKEDGTVLEISQSSVGDVGCVVWDAAIVLASYLETKNFKNVCDISKKRVLELGAGTGLVGLEAASLGGNAVITDLPEFVPLIELNIKSNQKCLRGECAAESLSWGEDVGRFLPPPDLLLIADCVYYEESVEPLVQTINDLSGPHTVTLCCFEERLTGNKPALQKLFFQKIEEQFKVTEIPLEDQHPHYRSPDIHIMKFTRR